jgi:hypothetical protein
MKNLQAYYILPLKIKYLHMKQSSKIALFSLAFLALAVTSCNKYEEGSNFTVYTKKARIVNEWTLESYQVNNVVYTEPTSLVTKYTFNTDGSYMQAISSAAIGSSVLNTSGKWAFSSDKTKLLLTASGNNYSTEFIIVALKNKELKLKETQYAGAPAILKFVGL